MKKILIEGTSVDVLDSKWETVEKKSRMRYSVSYFSVSFLKIKIDKTTFKPILEILLFKNEYIIETETKKAKFYLTMEEHHKIAEWLHNGKDGTLEIEFVGTLNEI